MRKRCESSEDLLPYRNFFRDIKEPKYNFNSVLRTRKRKACTQPHHSIKERISYSEVSHSISFDSEIDCEALDKSPLNDSTFCKKSYTEELESNDCNSSSDSEKLTSHQSRLQECFSVEQTFMEINAVEHYCLFLKQENAAVFCNYAFTAVAMQDFDAVHLSLKRNQYVVVQRRGVHLLNCYKWAYWCYCSHSEFIESMDSTLNMTAEEFEKTLPDCIHIQAMKFLFHRFDLEKELVPEDHLYDPRTPIVSNTAQVTSGIYSLNHGIVAVYLSSELNNRYGVVTAINQIIFCMLCHGSCKHTQYVNELLDSDSIIEDLDGVAALLSCSNASTSKKCSPVGISWLKTPFTQSKK